MNRDDVIRMAREAGVYSGANEMAFASSLERFFQAAYAAGAAAEREACAKLLLETDLGGLNGDRWLQQYTAKKLFVYAAAIRARGQA